MYRYNVNRRLLLERFKLEEGKNELVKALKVDDAQAAYKALTGMSGNELGLTSKEFNDLTKYIARAWPATSQTSLGNLEKARQLLGVTKGTPDPSLGRPAWIDPHQQTKQAQASKTQIQPQQTSNKSIVSNDVAKTLAATVNHLKGIGPFVDKDEQSLLKMLESTVKAGMDFDVYSLTKKELDALQDIVEEAEDKWQLTPSQESHFNDFWSAVNPN